MIRLRAHITWLLVAVLLLTGHSMAMARAMPAAVGSLVLCTGLGPVVVPMDAEGNPTGAPHICPDCALSLLDAVGGEPPVLVAPLAIGQRYSVPRIAALRSVAPERALARGPPTL